MKIIVDAFGGDNAPKEILLGAAQAVKELRVQIVAVGDEEKIRACAAENSISLDGMEIRHAPDVLTMHDNPTDVLKQKPDSSMAVGLRMLRAGEGDAFVSAGSTGALLVGATLLVRRLPGVRRPALATVIPGAPRPYLLCDCGANADCRPEMLVQFAQMGAAYAEKVLGVAYPTVGLINNGTEESKGGALQLAAHELLAASGLNFVGNVEARELNAGAVDVAVCDGFTGNVVLKLTEGVAKMMNGKIKGVFRRNTAGKLAYLLTRPALKEFKASMDYTEYGGAPILGVSAPVIKAHGSSNGKAFKNAIRQAKACVENDVTGAIRTAAQTMEKEEATQHEQ